MYNDEKYDREITELYVEFADQVYRCARRGLSHEDAEEITNSAFLAARRHWRRVREFERPVGYVLRTAINLRADKLTEIAARRAESLDDPRTPEPVTRPAFDEDVWLLHEALKRLSPREEQLVVLFYWTGLPVKAISGVLGISQGHISRTLSDARARLRRFLDPPPDDDLKGRHHG